MLSNSSGNCVWKALTRNVKRITPRIRSWYRCKNIFLKSFFVFSFITNYELSSRAWPGIQCFSFWILKQVQDDDLFGKSCLISLCFILKEEITAHNDIIPANIVIISDINLRGVSVNLNSTVFFPFGSEKLISPLLFLYSIGDFILFTKSSHPG